MAFTVEDFHDLVRLLEQHPEWQAEMRRLVLSGELLELPALARQLTQDVRGLTAEVQGLAQAQARTEQRIEQLAQAQGRTEERLAQLAQAQGRTEERLESLSAGMNELADQMRVLAGAQTSSEGRLAQLRGHFLEWRYRERADSYFGRLLRRLRVQRPSAVVDEFEERLAPDEVEDLLRADLILQGEARRAPGRTEVWLVVEISAVVDPHDVRRAVQRASILRQVGLRALPAVAGDVVNPEAAEMARLERAVVFEDGAVRGWEEALAAVTE